MDRIKQKTEELLKSMGIDAQVIVEDFSGSETARVALSTQESGFLIGYQGGNLQSFEYLLKKILQKEMGTFPSFFVDVNGYRVQYLEGLKEEARIVAKKVRLYRKEARLRPMNAFERKIVHSALAEYPDITTESRGDGPERRVVIKPLI